MHAPNNVTPGRETSAGIDDCVFTSLFDSDAPLEPARLTAPVLFLFAFLGHSFDNLDDTRLMPSGHT